MGDKGRGSVDNPVSPDYRGEMAVPGAEARPIGYGSMSAEELNRRLPDVTVLDLSRTSASPEEMKITGALIKNPDQVDWANDLPKGKVYVLYDESPDQVVSSRMADRLIGAGYDQVFVLEGGMQEWRKSGLPVEPRATAAVSGQSGGRSSSTH